MISSLSSFINYLIHSFEKVVLKVIGNYYLQVCYFFNLMY